MLKRAYNWVLRYADHPHAVWILNAVSFAESSFFPIPPDPLYLAMLLANRKQVWRLALYCTLSSVIGGVLGYYIGYALYESIGKVILEKYNYIDSFSKLVNNFDKYGFWIIAAKGLTPIPYKFVTIASGVAKMDLWTFMSASIIARGFRFFSVGALVYHSGPKLKDFIEKNLTLVVLGAVGALVLGFIIFDYIDEIQHYISSSYQYITGIM